MLELGATDRIYVSFHLRLMGVLQIPYPQISELIGEL